MLVSWNLALERPTLGGALTLRAEVEQIVHLFRYDQIDLSIGPENLRNSSVNSISKNVFERSKILFKPTKNFIANGYPFNTSSKVIINSYYELNRIEKLIRENELRELDWGSEVTNEILELRNLIGPKYLCFHARNVVGTESEWNANSLFWNLVIEYLTINSPYRIILIGDGQESFEGGFRANTLNLKQLGVRLDTQLALINESQGFIGTASGVATPAVLSRTPYLILKDPRHHAQEMEKELGDNSRFAFSVENQHLVRIEENFNLFLPKLRNFLDKLQS
jgi:hypothetical protein